MVYVKQKTQRIMEMVGTKVQQKSIKKTLIKIAVYFLGIMTTSLGINLLLRSFLGAGAWDTVTNNLSVLIGSSLGTASAIINITILLWIIIYNKSLLYLIVLIPIGGIALSIDFWDILIFGDFETTLLWLRVILFIGGGFVLTLGLAMMISTKYPAMVFDELTLSLMRLFHIKTFLTMRLMIELFAIILASGIGFIAGIGFGAVNLGSLILAWLIGPMISFHLKWIQLLKGQKEISA